MKKIVSRLSLILIMIIVFNLQSYSEITKIKGYSFVEVNKYDYRSKLISKIIKKYDEKGKIINRENYAVYEDELKLISVDNYIYDEKTELLKEENRRSPNLSLVFQSAYYKFERINEAYRIVEKRNIDYLTSTIKLTEYFYDIDSNKLTAEKVMLLNTDKQKYVAEKELSYNNDGKIKQIVEYKDDDEKDKVYNAKYIKYIYNESSGLIKEIRTFDKNDDPLSIIIVAYDDYKRVSKEIIYKPEVVLSENDMYFERRFMKEFTINYSYY